MLEESQYLRLADEAFKTIQDAFENVDPDVVDAYTSGDVLSLTFADRSKCVLNTQRPTRQIWLAARARAWHFHYDANTQRWMDDKGRGDELYATLQTIVREVAGLDVVWK
jgi:CyaY protein